MAQNKPGDICTFEREGREKAINMLKEFYVDYVFGLKPFQLDATKYCTPRFLSKLGEDYEAQLKEDYIISQEEVGLEWWRESPGLS